MHKFIPILALACLPFLAVPVLANEGDINFGAGLGFTYSGLGGYGAYTKDTQVFAASAGVIYFGGDNTKLGVGVSWLRTDLAGNAGQAAQHGLGFYIGSVGTENYRREDPVRFNRRNVWGGGPIYQFYQNGANNAGFVGGVAVLFGDARYGTDTTFGLSLGYQF